MEKHTSITYRIRRNESMVEHRTQIKIIGEILDTATQEIDEYEGTTITHIIRKANISHLSLIHI